MTDQCVQEGREEVSILDRMAEVGRRYPQGFLIALQQSAMDTLKDYLADNDMPSEVFQMVDGIIMLERHSRGEDSTVGAASIVETVQEVAELIHKMDGAYYLKNGDCIFA